MTRRLVVGVGNAWRRDDGIGPAVVAELERRRSVGLVPSDVAMECCDGEPARLLEVWAGAEVCVVVDAVRGAGAPGRVLVDPDGMRAGGASSHGLGVADAIELGRRLARLPARLHVVAVEVADVGDGPGLSEPVTAAVGRAADAAADLVSGPVSAGLPPAGERAGS